MPTTPERLRLVLVNAGLGDERLARLLQNQLRSITFDHLFVADQPASKRIAPIIKGRRDCTTTIHRNVTVPALAVDEGRVQRIVSEKEIYVNPPLCDYLVHEESEALFSFGKQILGFMQLSMFGGGEADIWPKAVTLAYIGFPVPLLTLGYVAFDNEEIQRYCQSAVLKECEALVLGWGYTPQTLPLVRHLMPAPK